MTEIMLPKSNVIKDVIKRTPIYDIFQSVRFNRGNRRALRTWQQNGKDIPPPHVVKQMTVKEYAGRFKSEILIETGTFFGEMIYATRNSFSKIYSIELSEELAQRARKRFRQKKNICIIQGDSPNVLTSLLPSVSRPSLIWLDAHYSGGDTAMGELETPIMQELAVIFQNRQIQYCILIDDARCFNGQNGYPTIEQLEDYVLRNQPGWVFQVENDIIRFHPSEKHIASRKH